MKRRGKHDEKKNKMLEKNEEGKEKEDLKTLKC